VDHNLSDRELLSRADFFLDSTRRMLAGLRPDIEWVKAARLLADCQGLVVTTGMGKAGHAARKAASSFCSLAIPSCYLHPGEASHGDSGILRQGDLLLACSTSGKTREVLETVMLAKQLGTSTVLAITSHPDGPLRHLADVILDMGQIDEAGYLQIAPTSSITAMLVVADILGTLAAELKGVQMSDFALRHHSGYVGEKSFRLSGAQRDLPEDFA
jgi:arabinose-5-phosphate isomerase